MLYKEGLADRFGSPIPFCPHLYRRGAQEAVAFSPDYQFLIGDEAYESRENEIGDAKVDWKKLKEEVLHALPKLPKRKREILTLSLVHHKSLKDIANTLNCSYWNIHLHIYGDKRYKRSGAIAQLKKILNQNGGKQK